MNGHVYLAMRVNGQSVLLASKTWIAEPLVSQASGTTDLTGGDLTTALTSLENHGITVRALGTKVVGGVSCTGYAVTSPGEQGTATVWVNPQHLVREINLEATLSVTTSGPSSTSTTIGPAVDMTMDFTYSAQAVHVTAPPAASTVSLDTFPDQLGSSPALKQLEQAGSAG